ncbi:recombinase family protein [Streptomyces sp. G-G2]|nr:recombinase family protein [Streptomyces sp. G-G2]MDJ0384594.1 recombinase family protein [Streptomyces sp. G-G2]
MSKVSDETTSPERQRRSVQRWADQEGHVVVGWVEDIDVSGGVEPWKRPEFSRWLPSTIGKEVSSIEHRIALEESRADEYDIICALKLDRLSRRVLHVHTQGDFFRSSRAMRTPWFAALARDDHQDRTKGSGQPSIRQRDYAR